MAQSKSALGHFYWPKQTERRNIMAGTQEGRSQGQHQDQEGPQDHDSRRVQSNGAQSRPQKGPSQVPAAGSVRRLGHSATTDAAGRTSQQGGSPGGAPGGGQQMGQLMQLLQVIAKASQALGQVFPASSPMVTAIQDQLQQIQSKVAETQRPTQPQAPPI